jgi:hypothetical protein
MQLLNPDFQDFIALLEKHAVDYLVVGGYAVALHGFPRYTGDIDFFVATNPRNAASLIRVFQDFGFGDLDLTYDDFLTEDFVVEIGREPRKIQVLTGIDGVKFDECRVDRVVVDIDGLTVKFIDKQNLLRNKAASARPKDLIDLDALS